MKGLYFLWLVVLALVGQCVAQTDTSVGKTQSLLPTVPRESSAYNAIAKLIELGELEESKRLPINEESTRYEFALLTARVLSKASAIMSKKPEGEADAIKHHREHVGMWGALSPELKQSRETQFLDAVQELILQFSPELINLGVSIDVFGKFFPTKWGEVPFHFAAGHQPESNLGNLASNLLALVDTEKTNPVRLQDNRLEFAVNTQTYLIHQTSRSGAISLQPHVEVGPSDVGVVLRVLISKRLNSQRIYLKDWVMPRPYWLDEDGVELIYQDSLLIPEQEDSRGNRGEFLNWTLSYGTRTDRSLIRQVKEEIWKFAESERSRLKSERK